ncbi:MAG: tetratricopeptide repeat protein, partial [Candidatus Binataceae bacterium]
MACMWLRVATLASMCAIVAGCAATLDVPADRPALPVTPASESPPQPTSADARAAFVDGYHAYRARNFERASQLLSSAADGFAELRDYALFYLASAERDLGRDESAAATFARLASTYPQSVHAPQGELELAKLQLKLGHAASAQTLASSLVTKTSDPEIEQGARLIAAGALLATNDPRAAYAQAMTLRQKFPGGPHDADARDLAYRVLRENPSIVATNTVAYYSGEAELLLKESQPHLALAEANAALQLSPPGDKAAELVWLKARALRGEPAAARRELLECLRIAPHGGSVTLVLEALALNYWSAGDNETARKTFARLVRDFPESRLAPDALLRTGRIYEEDSKFDSARGEYLKLVARYPSSDAANDARFRAPWMLYSTGRYADAAREFERMHSRMKVASDRDMLAYWRARSLERSGDRAAADSIYRALAASTDTNYYPALAALRVGEVPIDFPAAAASLPSTSSPPRVDAAAEFHLSRALVLRSLGLHELEADELMALEVPARRDPDLRNFVLAGLELSGAYYDLIVHATRLSSRGALAADIAEKLRYPRGYWRELSAAARQRSLDPYVVVALMRQESLFDPRATSRSDARGLMQ